MNPGRLASSPSCLTAVLCHLSTRVCDHLLPCCCHEPLRVAETTCWEDSKIRRNTKMLLDRATQIPCLVSRPKTLLGETSTHIDAFRIWARQLPPSLQILSTGDQRGPASWLLRECGDYVREALLALLWVRYLFGAPSRVSKTHLLIPVCISCCTPALPVGQC